MHRVLENPPLPVDKARLGKPWGAIYILILLGSRTKNKGTQMVFRVWELLDFLNHVMLM